MSPDRAPESTGATGSLACPRASAGPRPRHQLRTLRSSVLLSFGEPKLATGSPAAGVRESYHEVGGGSPQLALLVLLSGTVVLRR